MALVAAGYRMYVTVADNGGNTSTLQYALVAADAITADADAVTIVAALNAVSDAVVIEYGVTAITAENAPVLPGPVVQVEDKASITVNLDTVPRKKANLKIPAPKPGSTTGIFTADSGGGANVVNISNAALNTYVDIWKTGTALATISDGDSISAATPIDRGRRISVKSNRG